MYIVKVFICHFLELTRGFDYYWHCGSFKTSHLLLLLLLLLFNFLFYFGFLQSFTRTLPKSESEETTVVICILCIHVFFPSFQFGLVLWHINHCRLFTAKSGSYKSSLSSGRAPSTDNPDPLSPLVPIVHRFWQVPRATSRILTELQYVSSSWFFSALLGV